LLRRAEIGAKAGESLLGHSRDDSLFALEVFIEGGRTIVAATGNLAQGDVRYAVYSDKLQCSPEYSLP
jgi:hypothetical protein